MRILVTGAAGNSNQVLVPLLIQAGHEVTALDIAPLDYPCRCVRTSVLDPLALLPYAQDVNLIVHTAGCPDHSLPRGPKNPEAYDAWFQLSGLATHALYRVALQADVQKIIFVSTQSVYATDRGPGVIDEAYPMARPAHNYYSLSKVFSEDIGLYYSAHHGIQSIMLRPGNFTGLPEPSPEFLGNRLRREDVAQAEMLCLDYAPEDGFEAFNVLAGNPFCPKDLDDMSARPMELVQRYYPGAGELMAANGDTWQGTNRLGTIARAQRKLGYHPRFTFERYLERLGWQGAPVRNP